MHFLVLLQYLVLLLTFSASSKAEDLLRCSEGRSRLDSVAFLACQQTQLVKLHRMGIWITRALDPNWQVTEAHLILFHQKPVDGLSVCEYMDLINSTCLPLYSNCTLARERIRTTWLRQASKPFSWQLPKNWDDDSQAVADTELYGSPGEMLGCESTTENFNSTEIVAIREMVKENFWRQDSGLVIYMS